MAACSSNIGLSRSGSLRNEVVSGMIWSHDLIIENARLGYFVKEVALPVLYRNSGSRHSNKKKKQRRGAISMLEPQAEPQSSVAETSVTKDVIDTSVRNDIRVLETVPALKIDSEDGGEVVLDDNGGNGKFPNGRWGGSGGGGGDGGNGGDKKDDGDDHEEKEFGPMLNFEEVMRETQARGASLPSDMLTAAKSVGIRKILLMRYIDLQGDMDPNFIIGLLLGLKFNDELKKTVNNYLKWGSVWPLGFAMRSCSMLRNRMLADPSFLFKIGTEIVIDSCCATFAEVQKRGKDFWAEFELYTADLLVGVVVNVALVGMLAPYARIGQPSISKGFLGCLQHAYGALPSSVFEAERPGCRFSVKQRIATYFFKGVLYGSVGFACGLIGQGIANMIMTAKRSIKKSEEDIPVPPLVKSAALWGVFLAVSSNTRYQIINGLERVVEASPLAKNVPPVAMAFTVGVRFANNIYGGMQFVDWARWSGVQ